MARTKKIPGANILRESFGKYTYRRVWLGKKFTGGSRKNIGCKAQTLRQYRSDMKVICEEFGSRCHSLMARLVQLF